MASPLTRLRLIVRGRVQGVGFRWFARREARARALAGWVRNLPDGTVELEVQGGSDAVAEFEQAVRAGPPFARVAGIDKQVVALEGPEGEPFEIR